MTNKKDLRIRSKVISEGVNRVPNRAMLRAVVSRMRILRNR